MGPRRPPAQPPAGQRSAAVVRAADRRDVPRRGPVGAHRLGVLGRARPGAGLARPGARAVGVLDPPAADSPGARPPQRPACRPGRPRAGRVALGLSLPPRPGPGDTVTIAITGSVTRTWQLVA